MLTPLRRTIVLAALLAAGTAAAALAQETATDPHHPEAAATQTTPPTAAGEMAQPGPGLTGGGMMAGMMPPGMTEAMPMMRGHRPMMKIVFAITDADGDGGLSFEELSAIQKRVFDAVDADQSGTVTLEELQGFMRE